MLTMSNQVGVVKYFSFYSFNCKNSYVFKNVFIQFDLKLCKVKQNKNIFLNSRHSQLYAN